LDDKAALRAYTIYGKTSLIDSAWHSPTNDVSRFFKSEFHPVDVQIKI